MKNILKGIVTRPEGQVGTQWEFLTFINRPVQMLQFQLYTIYFSTWYMTGQHQTIRITEQQCAKKLPLHVNATYSITVY